MTQRLDNNFAVETSIDDIKKELGLTCDIDILGYIITLPNKDEFVAIVKKDGDSNLIGYTDSIMNAYIYEDYLDAINDAKSISKYDVHVCTLIETPDQFLTNPLWSNFD